MKTSAPTIDPKVYARRWKTLAVLSLSLVIIGLDNTILNVALPSLQEHFDASNSTLQWIVDSYLLVFAGLLLTMGTLGDRFGRKRALQAGLAIFGAASLAVLVADSAEPADRDPRGDGRRRRADHARDALDHHERLPARGARQGDRHLGRHGRDRHRPRAAVRRSAAGVVLLDVRLPRQRARHRHRHPRGRRTRPREPRPATWPLRPRRRRTLHRGSRLARLRRHRGARAGLDEPAHPGRLRAPPQCSSPRSCAGSCAPPEPMLNLSFFRNPRFSVGSAAISVAFFSLFGSIFGLTQYLQDAKGYSALQAGPRWCRSPSGSSSAPDRASSSWPRLGTTRVVTAGLAGIGALLATTLAWTPEMAVLAARAVVLRRSRCRWAGSWGRRPIRSWAPCPRRSPASPRR